MSLSELSGMTLPELEARFRAEHTLEPPAGRYRGRLLRWLDSPESRHRLYRPITTAMFERCAFGVDFDRRCWFFLLHAIRAGRFEMEAGPSRWRPTRVFALRYHASRLPGPIRGLLYDEIKPLSDGLCLGIGGLNLTGSPGEIFFFGLERD